MKPGKNRSGNDEMLFKICSEPARESRGQLEIILIG